MSETMTPNSNLVTWQVIEIWDTELPDRIFKALQAEQKRTRSDYKDDKRGAVYSVMWQDMLIFHGEDGYCIDDETLEVVETWLEEHRKFHGLAEDSRFWIWVKRS